MLAWSYRKIGDIGKLSRRILMPPRRHYLKAIAVGRRACRPIRPTAKPRPTWPPR